MRAKDETSGGNFSANIKLVIIMAIPQIGAFIGHARPADSLFPRSQRTFEQNPLQARSAIAKLHPNLTGIMTGDNEFHREINRIGQAA